MEVVEYGESTSLWLVVVSRRSGGRGKGEEKNSGEKVEEIEADMLGDR